MPEPQQKYPELIERVIGRFNIPSWRTLLNCPISGESYKKVWLSEGHDVYQGHVVFYFFVSLGLMLPGRASAMSVAATGRSTKENTAAVMP
jgi:hypothetical protein